MRYAPESGPVDSLLAGHANRRMLLTIVVHSELDVIASRLRARQIASLCGFGVHDQARIAAAVSELARNAVTHAGGGRARFFAGSDDDGGTLLIVIEDRGPGIPALAQLLAGGTGGLSAARRFVDGWAVDTGPFGTRIALAKAWPPQDSPRRAGELADAIGRLEALPGNVALSETRQQNRELTEALAALQARQDELIGVSQRLAQTNQQIEALNARLSDKAEALMSADRRKDEFLSVLSHELRGPLSAAALAARMLEDGPEPQHRSVGLGRLVGRQVSHMSRLVEDLLDVSRVSRGLVSLNRAPVDMRDVVQAAAEQLAAQAGARQHEVVLSLPARSCMVEGDRTRLLQVVANLLGNAIRYTPECGRIEIAVQWTRTDVTMLVKDNGIGIPAALMPHLFDLYTQAERPSGDRSGGLGLGLALVRSLVESHGGSVSACSAGAGCGSAFQVRLAALVCEPVPGDAALA